MTSRDQTNAPREEGVPIAEKEALPAGSEQAVPQRLAELVGRLSLASSRYFHASPGACYDLDVSAHCVSSGLVDVAVCRLADLYNGAQIRHVAAQLRNGTENQCQYSS